MNRPVLCSLFLSLLFPSAAQARKVTVDPLAASARAQEFLNAEQLDLAMVHAEIARDLNPKLPEPYLTLAKIYIKQNNKERAWQILLEGVRRSPAMPESALDDIFQYSTQPLLIAVEPLGKPSFLGIRGFATANRPSVMREAMKEKPRLLLLFTEKFVNIGNIKDTFKLLSEFKCPSPLTWLYESIRAKGFYYFGRTEDFEKSIKILLKLPSSDYRRLYEVGVICIKAGEDEAAETFLKRAQNSLSAGDEEYAKLIDSALKHPERLLEGE